VKGSLRLAVAVVVTAAAAALFAIGFRAGIGEVTSLLGGSTGVEMVDGLPWWARLALPAIGGLAVGGILYAERRHKGGGGVGVVMEAVVLGTVRVPTTRSAVRAAASWLAIASANSLGREGPLIQAGAALGEASRKLFGLDDARARLALAAGVAAGFASAYNAPIAAVLFVVEIVTGVLVLEAAVPIVLASVIATVITRLAVGSAPLYGMHAQGTWQLAELAAFAVLGVLAAPVGVGFLRVLSLAEHGWSRLPLPWRPALGGLGCGAVLIALPAATGNGFEPLRAILDGHIAAAALAWLVLGKVIATCASNSSGQPGGVFTPTLLIGGCVGALYALGLHAVFGAGATGPAELYALVGFAAALSATTHAPVMATVLACELSGDWGLVLPLLVATAIAAGLARRLNTDSVYTAELSKRGVYWRLTLDGRRVTEPAA
jgi:CIC family chloride channel protein